MGLLDHLRKREREDFNIKLPDTEISVNHSLKVVFLYSLDSNLEDDAYRALEQHLNQCGYFLQVIVAARGMSTAQE